MDAGYPALIKRVRGKINDNASGILRNNKGGLAVVTIQMLVGHSGDPIVWLDPECRRIEPSKTGLRAVIAYFGKDSP